MKYKIILVLAMLMAFGGARAQSTKVDKFLSEYEAFVKEVVAMPFDAFHGDTLNNVEKMERKFVRRYRWHYDDKMSIEQLEQFNKLRGRFSRKMTALNNRRRLAAAKGRISGFFERPPTTDSLQDSVPREERGGHVGTSRRHRVTAD